MRAIQVFLASIAISGGFFVSTLEGNTLVTAARNSSEAGQKAYAQRELQTLNSALQNFKSVGGVVPENSSVSDAIHRLKEGVLLPEGEYLPLSAREPLMEVEIADEFYYLMFDPQNGFNYVNNAGMDLEGAKLMPVTTISESNFQTEPQGTSIDVSKKLQAGDILGPKEFHKLFQLASQGGGKADLPTRRRRPKKVPNQRSPLDAARP